MATTRSLSSAARTTPSVPSVPANGAARHRLRAVDRDEVVEIADFLPPGATWLPAPPHTLPTLPGQPPMVGYLVLVPADQQPPFLPMSVPDRPDTPVVPVMSTVPEAGHKPVGGRPARPSRHRAAHRRGGRT